MVKNTKGFPFYADLQISMCFFIEYENHFVNSVSNIIHLKSCRLNKHAYEWI